MSWEPPGLVLSGSARDLRTGSDGRVRSEEASVRAGLDLSRQLVELEVAPRRPEGVEELIGERVGSGFRAQLARLAPEEDGTPLGLLLDDLPGSALISGYVHMRTEAHDERARQSSIPRGSLLQMSDVCSGWRAGGTAMSSVEQGLGVPMQDCPPAPDLDHDRDPLAWHAFAPLAVATMRRRRRIDVRGEGTVNVDAMFRDTFGEPDGSEVVLHEYTLAATLEGPELEVAAIEAVPRVLPFWECPLAADSVDDLVGIPVSRLRQVVPERLRSTRSCTHLNDLLRVLADVGHLVALSGGSRSLGRERGRRRSASE
jgi:Protein of unknown function (DUF2889)